MQELQVVDINHRETIRETRRSRNRCIRGIELIAFVSLAVNMLQAVIIYILQAGPV